MTISAVEAAWQTKIWDNETILAITDKIHPHEITDTSQYEIDQLSYGQEINFFEWVINRAIILQMIGAGSEAICKVSAEIRYTKQKDTTGDNWRAVRDVFTTLVSTVNTELGNTWYGTVDYYANQTEPVEITTDTINDVPCWRGVYRFEATLSEAI